MAITTCWALALAFAGSTDTLLFLAPALLIIAPLVAGHYVGETLIERLVVKRTAKPRQGNDSLHATPPTPALWPARGTCLIAFSLAKRPPPLRFLPQT